MSICFLPCKQGIDRKTPSLILQEKECIDFNTIHADYNAMNVYGHAITDMAVSKTNIQSVFNNLQNKVDGWDHLYVWWMGHGSGSGPGSCNLNMSISMTGEHMSDSEFVNLLNSISHYNKRNVVVMTCHSGGMVDNLNVAGTKGVGNTSSSCVQSSYSITSTCNGRPHAEFGYTFPNALRKKNPCNTSITSDYNSNGKISLSEGHQYNQAHMTTSTPQMADPDGISASTHLKSTQP